jgi:hypothetical protein
MHCLDLSMRRSCFCARRRTLLAFLERP